MMIISLRLSYPKSQDVLSIIELGPNNHNTDGISGPVSILVMHMEVSSLSPETL